MELALKNIENTSLLRDKIFVSIENKRNEFARRVLECLDSQDVSYDNPNIGAGDLSFGKSTFTISTINSSDKYSESYYDCTGIICSGISKITGERISFMSHQDPIKILSDCENEFIASLTFRLKEMFELAIFDTIDICFFGGSIQYCEIYNSNYLEMIKLISKIVKKVINKEIHIIIGPNNPRRTLSKTKASDFYFDNNNLALLAYKPEQENVFSNISFPYWEVHDVLSLIKGL